MADTTKAIRERRAHHSMCRSEREAHKFCGIEPGGDASPLGSVAHHAATILDAVEKWRAQCVGAMVTVPDGTFAGLPGVVRGATYHVGASGAGLCVLVEAVRRDGSAYRCGNEPFARWPVESIPELAETVK